MSVARGSKLQVQIYVNRRPGELSQAVLDALPSLRERTPTLAWVAPLEQRRFSEPKDAAFLRAVGYEDFAGALEEFWPAGGPVWDALGVTVFPSGRPGVVLVEGKSYPGEIYGPGCKATARSRERIASAISAGQHWLGVEEDPEAWLGSLYQSANRLAHLYWLREVVHVEAWLVNVLFVGDRTHGKPTTRKEWELALPLVEKELGDPRTPFAGHAYLDALAAQELTREARRA